jgi:genome maintenance exonuclease 1
METTYSFDVKNHIHLLEGKPLHGVTTVLQVISKPQLIQWAANEAIKHVTVNLIMSPLDEEKTEWKVKFDNFTAVLEEARTAHKKKKEKAGDWGTEVHAIIESIVKEAIQFKGFIYKGTKNYTVYSSEKVKEACDNFVDWAVENKIEFLESEKHVWSEKLWIGGICDLVIKMNGKKYVADIKTSSGIYNEHFFQMAAYAMCLEEMGEHQDVEGYLVINLKKDGTMQTKMVTDMLQNREAFKHALGLYKILNAINSNGN